MKKIKLNYSNMLPFLAEGELDAALLRAEEAHKQILNGSGRGSEMLGWKSLPSEMTTDMIKSLKRAASTLSDSCEVVVVIGIGGSYMGAKAILDALTNTFAQRKLDSAPEIVFAGQNLSGDYAYELKEMLEDKEVGLIVISKSGTTLEPALAFRYLRAILEDKYGKTGAAKRIIAITDASKGALKGLAESEGYTSFVIPDNVGGRYSVLTPVGLLPAAVAGVDIEELMSGAYYVEESVEEDEVKYNRNPLMLYAALRTLMYEKGKKVELMASFEPKLASLNEWWKQLYGESEGKEGKGLFPASTIYSTDLHSLGQYVQDGERMLFETFIDIAKAENDVIVRKDKDDVDSLNYVSGRTIGEINRIAQQGVTLAHTDGGVPNMTISIEQLDEEHLGMLFYFFEYACALSAYMLGVNPFDQEGVEEYKKNMFALLERPGMEARTEELKKRL